MMRPLGVPDSAPAPDLGEPGLCIEWGDGRKMTCNPPILLTMERNGTIDVRARELASKCGPLEEPRFDYRVRVTAPESSLCERGFIVDHEEIHAYFTRTFSDVDVYPSCERIAAQALRELREWLTGRGCNVRRLYVRIASYGGAGIEAEYLAPDGSMMRFAHVTQRRMAHLTPNGEA